MLMWLPDMLERPDALDGCVSGSETVTMTGLDPFPPADALGQALHFLRMSGAFYCRSELTAPWGLTLPVMPDYLWFHVVTRGTVRVVTEEAGEQRVITLNAGDERTWQANERFTLDVGNGGGLELYLDGSLLGTAGTGSRLVEGVVGLVTPFQRDDVVCRQARKQIGTVDHDVGPELHAASMIAHQHDAATVHM